MARMYNPPHPGEIIKHDILPELHIDLGEAARQLGVACVTLSRIVDGKAPISPDIAARLAQWVTGPSAETWLKMQTAYDLWQKEHPGKPHLPEAPARMAG